MIRRRRGILGVVVIAFVLAMLSIQPALAQSGPDTSSTSLSELSDYALWSGILVPVTSTVTAVINRSHWRSDVKLGAFFTFSVVAAGGNSYFNADLDAHNVLRSLMVIFLGGILFYAAAKPGLKAIEARTG